jgi:hypothetical protein
VLSRAKDYSSDSPQSMRRKSGAAFASWASPWKRNFLTDSRSCRPACLESALREGISRRRAASRRCR